MAKRRNRGEGSIFQKPDGTWRAQVCHQGQRLSHSAATRAECMAWVQSTQTEVGQGWNLKGAKTTVEDYTTYWMALVKTRIRASTLAGYETVIRNHIVPRLGQKTLKDLTPDGIDQFYADLLAEGVGIHTIRMCHRTLHVMLEKAEKYSYILRNPAHGATVPKAPETEMSVLDEEQVNRFLMAASGTRYEVLFRLAVTTGMRQGELFGLKWADISWQRGVLYLRRQVHRVPGVGLQFSEPKTKAGKRTIKLGEGMLQALREHKLQQDLERTTAGNRWKNDDLVFTSKFGGPMDQSNVRREFYAILEMAGLPKMRFHDLRHTAASLLLNNNIPVLVVSRILGHSKPSVTLDIYGHLYNEMQDDAARLMDSMTTSTRVSLRLPAESYAPLMHRIAPEDRPKVENRPPYVG
jgi:integrase